jgi:integrase
MPKRRARGEGSLTRRRDGTWQGSVTVGYDDQGRQVRRYVTGRTQGEARTKLQNLREMQRIGGLPTKDTSLADLLERWLVEKARQVKPGTIAAYRYNVEKYLLPRLGSHKLTKLTPLTLQLTLGQIADDVSANTSNVCRSTLYAALDQAVRWGLIPVNPVAAVPRLRHEKREMLLWTPDETRRFLTAAKGHRLYPLFYLAVTSGVRIGKSLALRWTDLENGRLHVRHNLSKVGKTVLATPKTPRSRRVVTLAEDALEELERHRQRQNEERELVGDAWEHPEHMFVSQIGTYLDSSNVRRAWIAIEKAVNVPHARLHDARHLHVSLLVKSGVDVRTIADRIGHTNAAFTLKQYAHAFDEQRQAAAIPLDTLLKKAT